MSLFHLTCKKRFAWSTLVGDLRLPQSELVFSALSWWIVSPAQPMKSSTLNGLYGETWQAVIMTSTSTLQEASCLTAGSGPADGSSAAGAIWASLKCFNCDSCLMRFVFIMAQGSWRTTYWFVTRGALPLYVKWWGPAPVGSIYSPWCYLMGPVARCPLVSSSSV